MEYFIHQTARIAISIA